MQLTDFTGDASASYRKHPGGLQGWDKSSLLSSCPMRSQFWCDAFLLKPAGAAVAPAQCPLRGRSSSAAIAVFPPWRPAVERIQPKISANAVARPYLDPLPGGPSFLLIGDVRKLLPQRPARPAASRGSESRQPEHERPGGPCRTLRRRNRSHDRVHEFVQHVGANETPQHSEGVLGGFAEQPVIRLGRRLSAYAGFHERRATRNNHGRAPERRGG